MKKSLLCSRAKDTGGRRDRGGGHTLLLEAGAQGTGGFGKNVAEWVRESRGRTSGPSVAHVDRW